MELVPEPPVMVPLVIVQAYVAPVTGVTEAVLPVELAQTEAGVGVMVQFGGVLFVHAVLETSGAPSSIEALAVLQIWVQSGVPVLTVVWNCTVTDV